jgi:hypothetical protein
MESYDGVVPRELAQELVEPVGGAERVDDPVVAVAVEHQQGGALLLAAIVNCTPLNSNRSRGRCYEEEEVGNEQRTHCTGWLDGRTAIQLETYL